MGSDVDTIQFTTKLGTCLLDHRGLTVTSIAGDVNRSEQTRGKDLLEILEEAEGLERIHLGWNERLGLTTGHTENIRSDRNGGSGDRGSHWSRGSNGSRCSGESDSGFDITAASFCDFGNSKRAVLDTTRFVFDDPSGSIFHAAGLGSLEEVRPLDGGLEAERDAGVDKHDLGILHTLILPKSRTYIQALNGKKLSPYLTGVYDSEMGFFSELT